MGIVLDLDHIFRLFYSITATYVLHLQRLNTERFCVRHTPILATRDKRKLCDGMYDGQSGPE